MTLVDPTTRRFYAEAAWHAEAVYSKARESESRHERRVRGEAALRGFELVRKFNQRGAQAMVCAARSSDVVFVSFRGTEVIDRLPSVYLSVWWAVAVLVEFFRSDAVIDLYARMTRSCRFPGHVHAGFLYYANRLLPDVAWELDRLRQERGDFKVVFTGHSLGGAAAAIVAMALAQRTYYGHQLPIDGFADIELVTFGAPPVGDRTWRNEAQRRLGVDRIHRLVYCCDIVPRMRTQRLTSLLQFKPLRHLGGLMYFDRTGDLETRTHALERWLDRMTYYLTHREWSAWRGHHRMQVYRRGLSCDA